MTLTPPHDAPDMVLYRLIHNEMTCEMEYCGHPNCVALTSYYLECDEDAGNSLSCPLPREKNPCDRCGKLPTAVSAITIYPGQPADPENGPSIHDLPMRICEACERVDPAFF